MNIWFKFAILYLIPLSTFAGGLGIYFHAYGRPPEETFIEYSFPLLALSLFVSSFLTKDVVSQFLLAKEIMNKSLCYVGIILSLFAWIIELIIVGLSLYFLYGPN